MRLPSRVVVMGVSGVGKSTIAERLAEESGGRFIEGDDLHSEESRKKMRGGKPLNDEDREPWLRKVGNALASEESGGLVVSCSALKRKYRDLIRGIAGHHPILFILLYATDPSTIAHRMKKREHFMPLSLLESQYATFEPLGDDELHVAIEVSDPLSVVLSKISCSI